MMNPTSVKGIGAGTATITVTTTDGGYSETFTVTVTANEIAVGETKELEAIWGVSEYYISLAGGKENTSYVFTATMDPDEAYLPSLSSVSDGAADYANYSSDGSLMLTTDEYGKVTIYVYANDNGTIHLTVSEFVVGEFEIMVGVDKEIESLTEEGATYTLSGCEDGEDYVLSIYDTEGNLRTDVSVQCSVLGIYGDGDPTGEIEFTYQDGASFEISSKEGTITDVVIKLEQAVVVPVNPIVTLGGEAVEITAGDNGVSILLEGCDFGKTYKLTALNYSNEISDEVMFWAGNYMGNPVEFEYGMMTRSITLAPNGLDPVTVYVKVEAVEDEEGGDNSSNVLTVGQQVLVSIDGDNEYAVYQIELEEGTYTIFLGGYPLTVDPSYTAYISTISTDDFGASACEVVDGNVVISESGTYYVICFDSGSLKVDLADTTETED